MAKDQAVRRVNMERGSISVVIPLYNKAPHIGNTLQSVLAQSSPVDEIIVVDDGSTDEGGAIATSYSSQGVRVVTQVNQGESAARNTGINESTCDYVAFLDADDFWYDNHIKALRLLIADHPEANLLSTAHVICRNGRTYRPASMFQENWTGIVSDFFSAYSVGLSLVNSTTACVKRTVLLDIAGFPVGVRRGPDIITWIRVALKSPVAHAEVVTAVYNQDGINRSNQLRETEAPGSLQFISRLLNDLALDDEKRRSLGLLFDRIAFFTAAGCCLNGDRTGAAAIKLLATNSGRRKVALAVAVVSLVPGALLRWAQRQRHAVVR